MRFTKPKATSGGGIDTSDATAISDNILLNRTAYARGEKLVGTMGLHEDAEETTLQPGESFQIIGGYHTGGVVKAEGNFELPSNYYEFTITMSKTNSFTVTGNAYVYFNSLSSNGNYCFFALIKDGSISIKHYTNSYKMTVSYSNGVLSISSFVSGTGKLFFYSSESVTSN